MRDFIFYNFFAESYWRLANIVKTSRAETIVFHDFVKMHIFHIKTEFKTTDTSNFAKISSHLVSSNTKKSMDTEFIWYLQDKGYNVTEKDLENIKINVSERNLTIFVVKSLYSAFKQKLQISPMIYVTTFWNVFYRDLFQYIEVIDAPKN